MKHQHPKRTLRELREALDTLDLDAVAREIDALSAGRLQAWRAKPAPARSAETPLPTRDAYDLWLDRYASALASELRAALKHAVAARARAYAILATMPLDMAQDLIQHERGLPRCVVCGSEVNVVKGARYTSSRCHADYEYRRRHGHDTPRRIWQARIERDSEAA